MPGPGRTVSDGSGQVRPPVAFRRKTRFSAASSWGSRSRVLASSKGRTASSRKERISSEPLSAISSISEPNLISAVRVADECRRGKAEPRLRLPVAAAQRDDRRQDRPIPVRRRVEPGDSDVSITGRRPALPGELPKRQAQPPDPGFRRGGTARRLRLSGSVPAGAEVSLR